MIIYFLDLFWKFCFFIFFNEKMTIVRIRSKDKFEFDWIRDDFLDLLDKKKKGSRVDKGQSCSRHRSPFSQSSADRKVVPES